MAFMNFSLHANSVGFYQITKLACVPCMVVIQTMGGQVRLCTVPSCIQTSTLLQGIKTPAHTYVLHARMTAQVFSRRIQATLAVIVLGVGLAVVSDMQLNAVGACFGAVAVACTTLNQLWIGSLQSKYDTRMLCDRWCDN